MLSARIARRSDMAVVGCTYKKSASRPSWLMKAFQMPCIEMVDFLYKTEAD
jgi:hypothetical protein